MLLTQYPIDYDSHCLMGGGCIRGNGEIITDPGAIDHELVHAVACELGWPDRVYMEGTAEAFRGFAMTNALAEIDIGLLKGEVGEGARPDYPNSERFVRALVREYGIETFMDAYAHTPRASGREGFEQAFEAAFGEQFDDASATLATGLPFYEPPAWDRCADLPELAWSEAGSIDFVANLDCSNETTLGPYHEGSLLNLPQNSMYGAYAMTGVADREYLLQLAGREGFVSDLDEPTQAWGVYIEECLNEASDEPSRLASASAKSRRTVTRHNRRGIELEEGRRYRIEVIAPMELGLVQDLQVQLVPQTPEGDAPPSCEFVGECDPREAEACGDRSYCHVDGCGFACRPGMGDASTGDSCNDEVICLEGTACVAASSLGNCSAERCCTSLCTVGDGDCSTSQTCLPAFEQDAPDGLGDLGICVAG